MKTFASSLALLVLLLGVGGYLWLERRNSVLPPGTVALLTTNAENVRSVEIAIGQQTLALQSKTPRGEWWVRSGSKSAPADPARVRALLQSLQLVQSSTSGDLTREQDYGLVPARATLTVITSEGRTELEFGNPSPVAPGQIYARANGIVGLISLAPIRNAVGDFESWRDHAILRFDPQIVTQFTLNAFQPPVSTTFQRRGIGTTAFWQIAASAPHPLQARADSETVDTFLRALASAQFKNNVSVSSTALVAPQGEVRVQTPDGRRVLKVFDTGNKQPPLRWAGKNAAPNPFMLPSTIVSLIDRPLVAWRDTTVLPFRIVDITRIQIKYGNATQLWKREGEVWRADTDVEVLTATKDALVDLQLAAQNLRATRFIPLSMTQKPNLSSLVEISLNDQIIRITRKGGRLYATSTALPDAAEIAPAAFTVLQSALQRLLPTPKVFPLKNVAQGALHNSNDKP